MTTTDTKQLVLDFFDLAFVQRRPAEAAERYLGQRYTQHNPTAPDGAEVFRPSSAACSASFPTRRST